MKKILIYSLLALFVCAMASCSKDEVFYDLAEGEIAATFSAGTLKFNDLTEADNGKISVPMYRGNVKGAATVAVEITGGEGVFTPSATSFNFADGENVAYIDFTFDYASLSAKPTTITVEMVNEEDASVNAETSTKFTLTRKLTWEKVGEGYYYSDYWEEGWPQDIYKAQEGDFYLLPGCWYPGTDFSFFCDGTTAEWYASETGYTYGSYGPVTFDVTEIIITEDGGVPAIEVDCNYILPSYGNYNLYTGYEWFVFPEGFSF